MKRYSKEFKSEAVRLSDEIGVKKAAEQLATLKKEKLYRIPTTEMTRDEVRTVIFRYILGSFSINDNQFIELGIVAPSQNKVSLMRHLCRGLSQSLITICRIIQLQYRLDYMKCKTICGLCSYMD